MVLHSYVVCFVFLVSVVVIDADSSLTLPKSTFRSVPFSRRGTFEATDAIDITVSRSLRSNKLSDERRTEDRTGGLSVSAIEKFKSAFMSSKITPEKLEKW
ncbi:RxLR effector protein, partial [Phytophthora megakarya]